MHRSFTALLLIIGLLVTVTAAHATTFYVDDDAKLDPGPGDPQVSDPLEDGTAAHPFDAIQEAIDASVDGDTVSVASGTYTGAGNIAMTFAGREIAVVGASDDILIDLEGTPLGFTFDSGEGASARLENIRIRNGVTSTGGAAIHCANASSPTIVGCEIDGHVSTGGAGGAVLIESGSAPRFVDCLIWSNSCDVVGFGDEALGGAVHIVEAAAEFVECQFIANHATSGWDKARGGAIAVAGGDLTCHDCQFNGNGIEADSTGSGGAIYISDGTLEVERCSFNGNGIDGDGAFGGAISAITTSVQVIDSRFAANQAYGSCTSRGGAIWVTDFNPVPGIIERCEFDNNRALAQGFCGGGTSARGGALYLAEFSVVDCNFTGNDALASSEWGGGVAGAATYSGNTFSRCRFVENTANFGGALARSPYYNGEEIGRIENCLLLRNVAKGDAGWLYSGSGGAVICGDDLAIVNSTFLGNIAKEIDNEPAEGGAVLGSVVLLANCIVRDNLPDQLSGTTLAVSYSNVEGSMLGDGNIDVDPDFVDPSTDDFRLKANSPCIDAASGLESYGDLDLDGNPRAVDDPDVPDSGIGLPPLPDMGAFEFQVAGTCAADLDASGSVGFSDLLQLLGEWGPCGACPADLDGDGQVAFSDLLVLLGAWGPC